MNCRIIILKTKVINEGDRLYTSSKIVAYATIGTFKVHEGWVKE